MSRIEIASTYGDPREAELFGMDPAELFGSFGDLCRPGHCAEPGDVGDVVGFSLGGLLKGAGKVVSAPVKVATKVVSAPVNLAVKGVKAVGKAPVVRDVVKAAAPIVNNPVVKLVAPQIPAVVGKGPMFDLGAKLNPGVAALAQAGKGRPEAAVQAAIARVSSAVIPAGAAFVAPATASVKQVTDQADKLVKAAADPRLRDTAKNVINRTVSLASKGDTSAVRAVTALQTSAAKLGASLGGKLVVKPPALPANLKPLAPGSSAARPRPTTGPMARGTVKRGSGSVAFDVVQASGSRAPAWRVHRTGRIERRA